MMANSYTAIVKYQGGGPARYRNVSNPKSFIKTMQQQFDAYAIFFYKHGKHYSGYWNKKDGLML